MVILSDIGADAARSECTGFETSSAAVAREAALTPLAALWVRACELMHVQPTLEPLPQEALHVLFQELDAVTARGAKDAFPAIARSLLGGSAERPSDDVWAIVDQARHLKKILTKLAAAEAVLEGSPRTDLPYRTEASLARAARRGATALRRAVGAGDEQAPERLVRVGTSLAVLVGSPAYAVFESKDRKLIRALQRDVREDWQKAPASLMARAEELSKRLMLVGQPQLASDDLVLLGELRVDFEKAAQSGTLAPPELLKRLRELRGLSDTLDELIHEREQDPHVVLPVLQLLSRRRA